MLDGFLTMLETKLNQLSGKNRQVSNFHENISKVEMKTSLIISPYPLSRQIEHRHEKATLSDLMPRLHCMSIIEIYMLMDLFYAN